MVYTPIIDITTWAFLKFYMLHGHIVVKLGIQIAVSYYGSVFLKRHRAPHGHQHKNVQRGCFTLSTHDMGTINLEPLYWQGKLTSQVGKHVGQRYIEVFS